MTDPVIEELFNRAREEPIANMCGTKLFRSGRQLRGECPICHSGAGKGRGGNFSVDPTKNIWFCFGGCGEGGDVIELEHRMHSTAGETRLDAAKRLVTGDFPGDRRSSRTRPEKVQVHVPDQSPNWNFDHAQRLWREGRPAEGTIVQRYLVNRGIRGQVLKSMLKHLRFHPMAYHSGPPRNPVAFPAMLGRVFAPAGATGGTHATYLMPDGSGKALIADGPSKVMWGPQKRDGAPGAVWLTHPHAEGPLIEGEGIETSGSAACVHGWPCRIVAALSLDRLQGGWLADARGRKDPDCPRPDPEKPGFTWPEAPAAPWGKIILAVDHDMKPLPIKVRDTNGKTATRLLTAHERALISATLAKASWRRTTAAQIGVMAPPVGQDWNDVLKERVLSE
ncbi:hypothetical protein AEAC466_17305 [Asticcacaulis sp. AC466]|uniref:DUF7146 domain-containing protein n=1 Tax=Asticcacaulis sp. AC466 TaxID=1282362 RepID=UPI0003C3C2CF|nr:CHC2 zinc finger domain-containing protein [Asticcacaulis sp. AC466]ESQ82380.1 hypothetical protein AEAC466_17305 [Asticcacaulis sp. AC466]